jgi:DNA modification methylase
VNEKVAAIRIARLPIGELRLHPRNPREHPKPGSPVWEILKRSIEHDYFDPLVWNEVNGFLVSGHFRLKVLIELGFTHVDVSVVSYTEEVHLARLLAANQLLGEWEEAILASIAGDIEAAGLDAALAGYSQKALCALLDVPDVVDDTESAEELVSKADELQRKWQVQLGDLWQIGSHRLLCGDCASLDNWQRLLQGGMADMMAIDPPYNVAYDQNQRKRDKGNGQGDADAKPITILNDDLPQAEYLQLLNTWLATASAMLKPGAAIYIAHADSFGLETRSAARDAGFKIAQCLIWVKQAWTLGRQDYQWQHEPILYGWKTGAGHYWQGGYSNSTIIDELDDLKKLTKGELITRLNHLRNAADTTIIREPRPTISDLHPTMKPVRLMARFIHNSSKRGETVLELFSGSGTTLIASEQLGRRCVATELDPKFCAVTIERATTSGLTATKIDGTN